MFWFPLGCACLHGPFTYQVEKEGVTALYSGISAALARQASYTTLRLGLYDLMKRIVFDGAPEAVSPVIAVILSSMIVLLRAAVKCAEQTPMTTLSVKTSVICEDACRLLHSGRPPTSISRPYEMSPRIQHESEMATSTFSSDSSRCCMPVRRPTRYARIAPITPPCPSSAGL